MDNEPGIPVELEQVDALESEAQWLVFAEQHADANDPLLRAASWRPREIDFDADTGEQSFAIQHEIRSFDPGMVCRVH